VFTASFEITGGGLDAVVDAFAELLLRSASIDEDETVAALVNTVPFASEQVTAATI